MPNLSVEAVWSSGILIVWAVAVFPGVVLAFLALHDQRRRTHTNSTMPRWNGVIATWYLLALSAAGLWTWQAAHAGILTAATSP